MPAKKFVEVLYKVTCIPLFWGVCRKPGNENLIRTTYVLPDGIKHKRGFVKDPEEAQRYLSLQDKREQQQVFFIILLHSCGYTR